MIEFVLMDLDDTILDFRMAEAVALKKTLSELGHPPCDSEVELYSRINAAQWKELEKGTLTREAVKLRRFQLLFEALDLPFDAEAARRRYEELLAVGHYYMPGAEALLRELNGKYRLFILSNGTTAVQNGRLASAGIAPLFEEIFLSEELGAVKPEKAFFDLCFSRVRGFDPARAIMVGDSLTSDILGGINAGIRTCWYNPQGKPCRDAIKPDFEIASLDLLPALLREL